MNMTEDRAQFTAMTEAVPTDWMAIGTAHVGFQKALPDRILNHLRLLDGDCGGFPIDRLQHCLQTATRAHRGGETEDYVVCALLHDIGDTLASANHPDIAAAIVKPYVSPELHWMVEQHGIFQGYYYFHHLGLDREMRERFRGHPQFEMTARFCEIYDQNSFDGHYDTMSLEAFEPMVRRVFGDVKHSVYKVAKEAA
jgi:predicted HD phosphohydrolase